MTARQAAVAGLFYPADAAVLRRTVGELLAAAPTEPLDAKAIIAPHAGYRYSGLTAAHAYRLLESRRDRIRRVVLIGRPCPALLSALQRPISSPGQHQHWLS